MFTASEAPKRRGSVEMTTTPLAPNFSAGFKGAIESKPTVEEEARVGGRLDGDGRKEDRDGGGRTHVRRRQRGRNVVDGLAVVGLNERGAGSGRGDRRGLPVTLERALRARLIEDLGPPGPGLGRGDCKDVDVVVVDVLVVHAAVDECGVGETACERRGAEGNYRGGRYRRRVLQRTWRSAAGKERQIGPRTTSLVMVPHRRMISSRAASGNGPPPRPGAPR